MISFTLRAAFLLLALSNSVEAQSFNIDFSQDAVDVPPPSFAAAGQAGFWTGVNPLSFGPPVPMRDRTGACTSVTIEVPPFGGGLSTLTDPALPADVSALFMDGYYAGDLGSSITMKGLLPGQYDLVLYGLAPLFPSYQVAFFGGQPSTTAGGFWSGEFEEGITHISVTITVPASGRYSIFYAVPFATSPPGWFSGLQLDPHVPALAGSPAQLSLSAGGTQTLTLNAGEAHAFEAYFTLGSVTGVFPGIDLGRVCLPLNLDAYMLLTINKPGLGAFGSFRGLLDANGFANASFNLPAGTDPNLAGITLEHSYLTMNPAGVFNLASNAVPLTLVQ